MSVFVGKRQYRITILGDHGMSESATVAGLMLICGEKKPQK